MENQPRPENKESIQFTEIASEILERTERDQDMRERDIAGEEWDENLDRENTEAMKRIVEQIGWPTVSKVGKEASHSAWLLVQHADHDPEFQQKCLELMLQEPESEVERKDIAYLTDRVRVNTGQGQLYGTQFREERDENGNVIAYGPQPIEEPEQLDERRAAMGLEPHAEYQRTLTRKYHPHLLQEDSD